MKTETEIGQRASGMTLGQFAQSIAWAMRNKTSANKNSVPAMRAATGAGETVGADGGFLVDTQLSEGLLNRIVDVSNVFSRTTRITVDPGKNALFVNTPDETSRADGSRWGGVQVHWIEEGATPTATKPKLRGVKLKLQKAIGLCWAVDELMQDAASLEAVLSEGFREELSFELESGIVAGPGGAKMLGILNSDALVEVAKESGQAAATISWENIKKMWARLWGASKRNAVWLVNDDALPELLELTVTISSGGGVVPAFGSDSDGQLTLLGRPVIPCEHCSTLGTVGDLVLADLSQYVIAHKPINEAFSMHTGFTDVETAFRIVYRVNGQPLWPSAVTPKNGSDEVSPYVALATRA